MTKKDYELIASSFQVVSKEFEGITNTERGYGALDCLRRLYDLLVEKLLKDNPKFNEKKFWEACHKE